MPIPSPKSPGQRALFAVGLAAPAAALAQLARPLDVAMLGLLPLFVLVPAVLLSDPAAARATPTRSALALGLGLFFEALGVLYVFICTGTFFLIPFAVFWVFGRPLWVLGVLRIGGRLRRWPIASLGGALILIPMDFMAWTGVLSLLIQGKDNPLSRVSSSAIPPEAWVAIELLLCAAWLGFFAAPLQAPDAEDG